jgi:hypothetical protein
MEVLLQCTQVEMIHQSPESKTLSSREWVKPSKSIDMLSISESLERCQSHTLKATQLDIHITELFPFMELKTLQLNGMLVMKSRVTSSS